MLSLTAGAQTTQPSTHSTKKASTKTGTAKTCSKTTAKTPTSKSHSPSKTSSTHRSSHTATSASAKKTKSSKKTQGSWRTRGQQSIDNGRAREIQTALIQNHYMEGQPSGQWDASTKAAMVKFQQDNGWQTKKIPDSRALIKLGLGPDHANLINPETAAIQKPESGKGGSPQN